MQAEPKHSFMEALADFLSLAALSVVEPKRVVRGVRRLRAVETDWRAVSGMYMTAVATTSAFTFSSQPVLTDIPAGGAMVLLDQRGRLHCDRAPAAVYPDGNAKYFWHGVHVPEYVVKEPQLITPQAIDEEQNQEIRRVMVERYGVQRYIENCGAKLISKDDCGELYGKNEAPDTWEPLRFVKVKNSTAEPDGTFKDYFIRVPPAARTAKEGVAWTFGVDPKHYAPQKET